MDIINEQGNVTLERDWGGNSLTVCVEGQGHTHVGMPEASFEDLVDQLHSSLTGGPGLSWVKDK